MLHGCLKVITCNNCGHAEGEPEDKATLFTEKLSCPFSSILFFPLYPLVFFFSLPPCLLPSFLPPSLSAFLPPSLSSFLPPSLSSFLPLSSLLVFFLPSSLLVSLPPSYMPGTWTSQPTTGCVPPPCVDFSFTCVDGRRAVVFGGYQPQTGITNDTYLIDMDTWVMRYYENRTIHMYIFILRSWENLLCMCMCMYMLMRDAERSKQSYTNNKAKQCNTPKEACIYMCISAVPSPKITACICDSIIKIP